MKAALLDELDTIAYLYRQSLYRDVCVRSGVLLESHFRDLYERAVSVMSADVLASHLARLARERAKENPKLRGEAADWSLVNLLVVCRHREVRVCLESLFPEALSHLDWKSLEWVAVTRNNAAHGDKSQTTEHDAWRCKVEVERCLRFFDQGVEPSAAFARAKVFPNFYDAITAATPLIAKELSGQPLIHLRLLGLTLSEAWGQTINQVVPALFRGEKGTRLHLDLAMLDSEWPELARLNKHWPLEARQSEEKILAQAPDVVKRSPAGFRIRLFKYRNHPTYHGFIANDNIVVGSTCRMLEGRAKGTNASYFGVRKGAGDLEQFLVDEMSAAWKEATHGETGAVVDVSSPGTEVKFVS